MRLAYIAVRRSGCKGAQTKVKLLPAVRVLSELDRRRRTAACDQADHFTESRFDGRGGRFLRHGRKNLFAASQANGQRGLLYCLHHFTSQPQNSTSPYAAHRAYATVRCTTELGTKRRDGQQRMKIGQPNCCDSVTTIASSGKAPGALCRSQNAQLSSNRSISSYSGVMPAAAA